MKELYALAYFDDNGELIEFIRKGRNNAISGYDNLTGARRGLAHSKNSWKTREYNIRIVKATGIESVE
jgi:hypothetical protein